MASRLFMSAILLVVPAMLCSACAHDPSRSLTVTSGDSTRVNAPFLIAYVCDDGTHSPQPMLIPAQTPFHMDVPGSNYLIVLRDTSANGPHLYAKLSEGRAAAGVGVWINGQGSVFFKSGEHGGGVGNL